MAPYPRVRFYTVTDYADLSYNWAFGPGVIPNVETTSAYRYMADTVGRTPIRPCNHVEWYIEGTPQSYHSFMTEGLPVTVSGVRTPIRDNAMDNILDLPSEASLQNSMLNAFNSFSTVFPSKFAPIEFVEGLRDWRSLIPSLSGDWKKDLASFYLGQKWGRDQLFADIMYLTNLLNQCKSRLEWLRRTYGKPTPLYYRERLEPPTVASWRVQFWPGSWGTRFTLEDAQLVFSARATLLHRIPHLNDLTGLYQACVSALGLNNPLKAIWQSLRLSFVFDWIVNVSGLLDRLAQIRPAAEWTLYDVCHSVKLEARFRIDQDNHWSGTTSDNVFLNNLRLIRYRRSLGLPLVLTDLMRSSFSPNQLLALTAMVTSKTSR